LRIGSLVLAGFACQTQAADMGADHARHRRLAYREDFFREAGFPTRPEVDPLRLGGMVGFSLGGDPMQEVPVLVDGRALARVTSVGGFAFANEVAGASVAAAPVVERGVPFAARARFSGFRVDAQTQDGVVSGAGANGFTAVVLTNPSGYFLSASVFIGHVSSGKFASLNISESGGADFTLRFVQLPGFVEGMPFDLELRIDPTTQVALARIVIDGASTETPALPLVGYASAAPERLNPIVGLQNAVGGTDWGAGDAASAEILGFCVYDLGRIVDGCRFRK
jgi:hypothetical protein